MVRLGDDRWKGLFTEWVILNEGGWRRMWTWSTGGGETIFEARWWELSARKQYSGDRDAIWVSQREVGVLQWEVEVSQWEIGVSQWEW